MRRILRRTPLLESRWRFAVLGGLAAFVALDVVLVVIAARGTAPGPVTTPGPIPTYTSTPIPAPVPTRTATPTPTATPSASTGTASAGSRTPSLLSAVSATEAWRVTSGSCPTSSGAAASTGVTAIVEHTADAGATWSAVSLSAQALDTAVGLNAGTSKVTVVGGRTAACTPVATTSFTTGRFWADAAGDLAAQAFVTPDGASLHLSTGTVASPCPAASRVLEGATQTAVVCGDGLHVRAGAGSWWTVPLTGLAGIAPTAGAFTIARTGVTGCSGVEIQALAVPVTPSSTPRSLGCAPVPAATASALTPSNVALSRSGSALWLWAGTTTLVSGDGGATW